MKTFTVIINVHNGAAFLEVAIRSVLNQTFKDFEVMVFDNASTDDTQKISLELAGLDSRVLYIRREEKLPLYAARNLAVERSSGELIAFLDSDDIWSKDRLTSVLSHVSKNPQAQVLFSNFLITSESGAVMRQAYFSKLSSLNEPAKLSTLYPVAMSSLVLKREIFSEIKAPFDPQLNIIGDYVTVCKLAEGRAIEACQAPLVSVRVHDESMSRKESEIRLEEVRHWWGGQEESLRSSDLLQKQLISLLLDIIISNGLRAIAKFSLDQVLTVASFSGLSVVIDKLIWKASNFLHSRRRSQAMCFCA